MKSPFLAFALNFFLPGAGLWYLGKPAWGLVNLLAVLAVGVAAVFALPEQTFERYIRFIAIGCAGGSGGLAQALAMQRKKAAETNGQA